MKIKLTDEQVFQILQTIESYRTNAREAGASDFVPGFGLFAYLDMSDEEDLLPCGYPREVELLIASDEGGSTYGMKEFYRVD